MPLFQRSLAIARLGALSAKELEAEKLAAAPIAQKVLEEEQRLAKGTRGRPFSGRVTWALIKRLTLQGRLEEARALECLVTVEPAPKEERRHKLDPDAPGRLQPEEWRRYVRMRVRRENEEAATKEAAKAARLAARALRGGGPVDQYRIGVPKQVAQDFDRVCNAAGVKPPALLRMLVFNFARMGPAQALREVARLVETPPEHPDDRPCGA